MNFVVVVVVVVGVVVVAVVRTIHAQKYVQLWNCSKRKNCDFLKVVEALEKMENTGFPCYFAGVSFQVLKK